MSGPKVVRIVTREEIIAICEGHLRRLDQAIAAWTHDGKRIRELSDEDISATLERRQTLAALLTQDAFRELQKRVPEEIAYLHADTNRRRQLAVDKAVQAKKRQRQGRDSAVTLLAALKARGVTPTPELAKELESIGAAVDIQHADAILSRGFALLAQQSSSDHSHSQLSDAQRAAAASLMPGIQDQDYATWKASNASILLNPRIEKIDRQIAELGTILEMETAAEFAARLRSIEALETSSQQNLLLDSLILDLASTLAATREQQSAVRELMTLASELRVHEHADQALLERIDSCSSTAPLLVINELTNECLSLLKQIQQSREAEARRKVILQGLAKLGYEVNEGMETAWAQNGHVIAKKASLPGYGVEIGGQAESGRLQVRSVALSNNRDTSRDRDIETIWCGEFSQLQELLAEHGDNLVIERALGVGNVPLKVIAESQSESLRDSIDSRNMG